MKQKTHKECKVCGTEFKMYRTTDKYCSIECQKKDKKPDLCLKSPKKRIKQVSEKRKLEDIIYKSERIKFLSLPENQKCPVTGEKTTQIHHMRKRRGYADEWARENKVSLYLDKRFWLAVSARGHEKIENNPQWAYEQGFSIRSNQKLDK
jgi:hypothetical protein